MRQERDVIKEMNAWVAIAGEQKAVEQLNARHIPIKTIELLVSGRYRHQPRALLKKAIEEILAQNSDKAS